MAKIALIGCGNMGRSLVGGLIATGYPAELICGVEPAAEPRQAAAALGIAVSAQIDAALNDCAVIVLAVKPDKLRMAIAQLRPVLTGAGPLFISVAAGVKTAAIAADLEADLDGDIKTNITTRAAIVRVMPNTPALLRQGAAALFANAQVSAEQRRLAGFIMQSVGTTIWLEREELLDAVTAISGSGPAYFFLYIELLEKLAGELGLEANAARALVGQTALGAAAMVNRAEHPPAALREQVTSPGGTTEQALRTLMDGRLERLLREAVGAAWRRSVELSATQQSERQVGREASP